VPEIVWLKGHYSDNWTAENFEFTINNQQDVTLTMALWNPSPLTRKFTIKSSVDVIQGEILSGSTISVNLKTAAQDTIKGNVSPAFIPRQHDAGPDDRSLGLYFNLQLF
jgi:hypothetical protein